MARTKQTARAPDVSPGKPVKIATKDKKKAPAPAKVLIEKKAKSKPAVGRVEMFSQRLATQANSLIRAVGLSAEVNCFETFKMPGKPSVIDGTFKTLDSLYGDITTDMTRAVRANPSAQLVFNVAVNRTDKGKYEGYVKYWIMEQSEE